MANQESKARVLLWHLVEWGGGFTGFILDWALVTVFSMAGLILILGTPLSVAFVPSLFLGELVSGLIFVPSALAKRRRRFLLHSVGWILGSRQRQAVKERLSVAFENLRQVTRYRLGAKDYQAYLLKPLHDNPTLPEEELPKRFSQMSRAIILELVDKTQTDSYPWPSVEPLMSRLTKALKSDTQEDSTRRALSEAYLSVSPWYRRSSVAPTPSAFVQFLDPYEGLLQISVPVLVSISAIVVALT